MTGDDKCDRPSEGWECTREPGHDGPCAAWPTIHLGRRPQNLKELQLYNSDGSPRKRYTDRQMMFGLYKEQIEEASAWREKHIQDKHKGKHPYAGAIGGAFGWRFIPTGLGDIAVYFCMCGEEIDVTDTDNW